MWVIVIYVGELVWVGVIGCIVGECLLVMVLFGGVFVVFGIFVSEFCFVCKRLRDDGNILLDCVLYLI